MTDIIFGGPTRQKSQTSPLVDGCVQLLATVRGTGVSSTQNMGERCGIHNYHALPHTATHMGERCVAHYFGVQCIGAQIEVKGWDFRAQLAAHA